MHAQVYPPSRTTQFVLVGRGEGVDAEELIVPSTRARRARRPRGRLWALLRTTFV